MNGARGGRSTRIHTAWPFNLCTTKDGIVTEYVTAAVTTPAAIIFLTSCHSCPLKEEISCRQMMYSIDSHQLS